MMKGPEFPGSGLGAGEGALSAASDSSVAGTARLLSLWVACRVSLMNSLKAEMIRFVTSAVMRPDEKPSQNCHSIFIPQFSASEYLYLIISLVCFSSLTIHDFYNSCNMRLSLPLPRRGTHEWGILTRGFNPLHLHNTRSHNSPKLTILIKI